MPESAYSRNQHCMRTCHDWHRRAQTEQDALLASLASVASLRSSSCHRFYFSREFPARNSHELPKRSQVGGQRSGEDKVEEHYRQRQAAADSFTWFAEESASAGRRRRRLVVAAPAGARDDGCADAQVLRFGEAWPRAMLNAASTRCAALVCRVGPNEQRSMRARSLSLQHRRAVRVPPAAARSAAQELLPAWLVGRQGRRIAELARACCNRKLKAGPSILEFHE